MSKRLLITLCCLMTTHGYAANSRNIPLTLIKPNNKWGNVSELYCMYNDIPNACIGESATDGCKPYSKVAGTNDTTFGLLMMMARKITANGAMFCPTQIDAQTSGSSSVTLYREPNGNDTCVWLCLDGYTGHECKTKIENFDGTCDITPFLRSNYSNTKLHLGGGNIEFDIPLFSVSSAVCSSRTDEYDIALMINKWLDSGNGAFVRQMMVRGRRESVGGDTTAMIYPAANSMDILVCKNGHKPNASGTDCEPINPTACTTAAISAKMCPQWTQSTFIDEEHKYVLDGNCYRYACTQPNYAFTSLTNHMCTECVLSKRDGINPENGTCVKCPAGQLFNANAQETGYCKEATKLTKNDLMYGRNQTTATNTELSKQCWTISDPETYKKCVLEGGITTTKKEEPIQTSTKNKTN